MRVLLAWAVTQTLGVLAGFFIVLRDEYRRAHDIELSLATLAAHADRLVWIGLSLTGFVIFDFVRRATNPAEQPVCAGAVTAWLVTFCVLLAILFAATFGMLLMADAPAVSARVSVHLLSGYGALLVGSFLSSILYVLRVEYALSRR